MTDTPQELLPDRLEYDTLTNKIYGFWDGEMHMFADMRGWGFLTGTKSLSKDDAVKIQDKWADLICELYNGHTPYVNETPENEHIPDDMLTQSVADNLMESLQVATEYAAGDKSKGKTTRYHVENGVPQSVGDASTVKCCDCKKEIPYMERKNYASQCRDCFGGCYGYDD